MTQTTRNDSPELTWAQQQKATHKKVQDYTMMDDIFMSTVLSDRAACQYVLRIILQEPGLIVREVTSQKTMSQLYGKSPRLDVIAETPDGRIINIEIQQEPEEHYGKRLRFYAGTMVAHLLLRGVDYKQLPDQVMIYIGDTDIWKQERTIYEFQMTEIHAGFQIGDGLREIFVNTAVDDGSPIAKLMQYFTTADPYDMTHGDLSKQINFYKVEQEGLRIMKSLSQQIFEEGHSTGHAKGHAEGHAEGQIKGQASSVYALMQHQNCDMATAMDILNIHGNDRKEVQKLLESSFLISAK